MLHRVKACHISKPVTLSTPDKETILDEMLGVRVHGNAILKEIMAHWVTLKANPIISVDGTVYRIKLLDMTDTEISLLQQNIRIYTHTNSKGRCKTVFDVVSFRKVRIVGMF